MADKRIDLYKMDVHETVQVNDYTDVMRVLTGWVYTTYTGEGGVASVFVPEEL